MRWFSRIKKLVSKKPFKLGDRIECPCCKVVFTMVKFDRIVHKGELK